MILEVNGIQYREFTDATANVSMETLGGDFTFTAVTRLNQPLPFKGNEPCRVLIDGEPVITGHIESVSVDYSANDHYISISGRDSVADLGDSSLAGIPDLVPPLSLKDVCERVIATIPGLEIPVVEQASPIERFTDTEELVSPEVGANAFDYLEGLARQRQVLLTTDGVGNLLLARASTDTYAVPLRNTLNSRAGNNVLSASVTYDFSQVFRNYIVTSQENIIVLSPTEGEPLAAIVDQVGSFTDDQQRAGRQHVVISEESGTEPKDRRRAEWEADVRRARSIAYSATVQGYKNAEEVWKPNRLISVVDEFADINETMLIISVSYNFSSAGTTVILNLVRQGAFSLGFDDAENQRKGEDTGNAFRAMEGR